MNKRLFAACLSVGMLLAGCSAKKSTTVKDGTYEETVDGRNGKVTVSTTISSGKITNVEVKDNKETPEIAGTAITELPKKIVEKNSPNVDGVTGATITSDAIKEAVKNAIKTAGGDPDSFGSDSAQASESKTEKLTADVVVIGAGGAGITAALTAQQNGAKVILLEKSANIGGVSVIAGGPMGINSKEQKEAGVAGTFTTQEILAYWQSYNCWMDDGQLFYNIANRSGETIDWLEENGMDLVYVGNEQKAHANGFPTYHAYADQSNKLGYYQALLKQFENAGGKIYYQTPAVELKSEDNKITGVVAKSSDTTYEISCDAAVLATGGFGANADVIEKEVGFPLVTFTTGTQTGDGATMSQAIGAGKGKTIQQYHGVTSYSGIEPGSGKDEIAKAIYLTTSIWVNQRGSRFAPEDLNYDTALSSNAAATQGEYYFSIMSDDMVKKVEQGGSKELNVETAVGYQPSLPLFSVNEPWTEFRSALEDGVKNGTVFKGDTVEDLAKAMGVDANALKKTISAYNADCANGSDAVYGKDSKYMLSLGDGPYYAVKARPVSLGGIGGVLVNSNLEVIKQDGTVIGGLYAAGNEIAEIYNNSYPLVEGVTLMTALTGGRICGEAAAEYATK